MTRPSVEAEKCLRALLSIGLDVGYGATPAVPAAVPAAPVPVGYVPLYLLGISTLLCTNREQEHTVLRLWRRARSQMRR